MWQYVFDVGLSALDIAGDGSPMVTSVDAVAVDMYQRPMEGRAGERESTDIQRVVVKGNPKARHACPNNLKARDQRAGSHPELIETYQVTTGCNRSVQAE